MPRRKRSTFGCVQEMRRGVWRLRWPEDTPEGRKRRSETVYGTRRDAERRLAEIRVATREAPTPTVGQIWEAYVRPAYEDELESGAKKPQTVHVYFTAWENSTAPRWADVPVGSLRAKDVQDWLLTISNGYAGRSLMLLRAVTSMAQMLDVIEVDPMQRRFRLPKRKSRAREVPDLAELARVWDLCRGTWVEPVFLLCAHAGLRVGEAAAVKPGDIEWVANGDGIAAIVSVERQITEEQQVETPKYGSARRAVLPDPWATRLREIVGGLREDAVWVMDDGASEPSIPPSRSRVKAHWERAVRAEYPHLHLQHMRPAFETYMVWEWHVPQQRVSKMMGHKTVAVTQAYYDRPGDDAVVAAALEAARDNA